MKKLFLILACLYAMLNGGWLQAQQPNVLFIAIDDLRTALGCYGDTLVQSPNIDRLASQSRVFQRAYCMQAVCGPSRTSLLTGRLPDNTRVWHNRNMFRVTHPDLVTLPQHFKNNGYQAISLGKIFSGDERELDPASWSEPEILKQTGWRNSVKGGTGESGKGAAWEDADVPDDGYSDGKLASLAIEKLSSLKANGKPFFLAVGFFKPHLPFNAPKRYWDLYDPKMFDVDDDRQQVNNVSIHAHHSHRELGGYRDMPEEEHLDAATARTLRHGYYACVSYVDAQIGKLLKELDRLELAENTIVVLWGDHGYSLGEKDRWCKGTNFERDTRVPLIIRTPSIKQPGANTTSMVELVDLYPTLTSFAGLDPMSGLDGRSLQPILDDPSAIGRNEVLSQFARPFSRNTPEYMGYSLRTATHRYTRWISWADRKMVAEELYDYGNSNCASSDNAYLIEQKNIADQPEQKAQLEQLSGRLEEMLKQRVRSMKQSSIPPASTDPLEVPQPKKKRKKS
jgi:iduronate 2-sulfatase